ncbi:MAG: precorrin-6Y C5,15-methyltransferase (decarboxylating) subunit CbiT [Synergistaceae bacterium]|jgi:precorrin-6Y C5,15-methyltransferase (decarboxylating) CbiT subunit|nr:precorrin-6Y C5,15-methyltransferase (decarboxylating) subunit CbiT [Synergistaceae bacterium]
MSLILRDDALFCRSDGVPLTKAPLRALLVGLLAPLEGQEVIEVGTGSGGVTVTLAEAVGPGGKIWALEPSQKARETTENNLRRFGLTDRVNLFPEAAPEGLIPLPAVSRAFVGGHGPHLEAILVSLWDKMLQGGRLVLSAVLPETALAALTILEKLGAAGAWNIFPAQGRKLGPSWMFEGGNPAYLIWCDKDIKKEERS